MSRVTDIPHLVYTAEFKLEAVKLAKEVGVAEAARRLDMPTSSIRNWMKSEARSRLTGEGNRRQPVSEAQAEIARLRREVASLKADNEILRKAAAYFAKGSRRSTPGSKAKAITTRCVSDLPRPGRVAHGVPAVAQATAIDATTSQ
jgi:transposase